MAIDQAAIDLCFAIEGSESLQQRVEQRDGLHTLEHAEEIGLGSRTYDLMNMNEMLEVIQREFVYISYYFMVSSGRLSDTGF